MKNKYFSKKATVDGIEFDSQKEAKRYSELRLLERAGKIRNLQIQVPYVLIPPQYEEVVEYTPKRNKEKVTKKLVEGRLKYIADFVYEQNGEVIVEDVKGYKKSGAYSIFVIKRKLMLYNYGIKVREI